MRLQINLLSYKILTNQPLILDLRISQGDTFILDLFFTAEFNYLFPRPMYGAKILFTAKRLISDTDENAAIICDTDSSINAMGGEALLTLTPEMTSITPGNYIYGIKVVEVSGQITKAIYGNLCIEYAITRRNDIYEG